MPQTILEKTIFWAQMSLFGLFVSIITIAVILSLTNKKESK